MVEFWTGAAVLGYFLAGISKLNTDIRSGRLNEPGYVRDGRKDVAIVTVAIWPLRSSFIGFILTLISTVLITYLLMSAIGIFAGWIWQILIVAIMYTFLLLSNLAMIRR